MLSYPTHELNFAQGEQESLIYPMAPTPLSTVPFHQDTAAIIRYFAQGFPLHIAVHQVSPVQQPPDVYTQPHSHDDCNEVNMLLSQEELEYKIQLGEQAYVVRNNACIWIPRGMIHSANVLKGSGYFIAIRLDKNAGLLDSFLSGSQSVDGTMSKYFANAC